jgi:FtsZ-binding cell division protein ZapB
MGSPLIDQEVRGLREKVFALEQEIINLRSERDKLQQSLSEFRSPNVAYLRQPNLRVMGFS